MADLEGQLRGMVDDVVIEATGRGHRRNAVLPVTGGPAGNARLIAWTGLILLALFVAEVVTLIDVRGLISWHIVVGVLLVPPALLKTATTGWRILRYYTGHHAYLDAGPPPMVLRVLGPLVVLLTLALLASGLTLILTGPDSGRNALFTVLGQRISVLTLHQGMFILWGVVIALHVLTRLVPALRATMLPGRPAGEPADKVPGSRWRITGLVATAVAAGVSAALVLGASGDWRTQSGHGGDRPEGISAGR